MRKERIKKNVRLIGVKNFKGEEKLIDYYILSGRNEKTFAFSHRFTNRSYEVTRGGIRIEDLLFTNSRRRDQGLDSLVKTTRRMLPYLADEYELDIYEAV